MRGSSDANSARSKWTSRASTDPFASASLAAPDAQNGHETTPLFTDQQSDGKENRVPLIDRNWGHPNVSMDRSRQQTTLEEELLPPTLDFEPSTSSTLLGKRPNPTEDAPRSQKSVYRSAGAQDSNNIEIRQLRDPLASANAVTHFESRALELHGYLQELEDQQEENAGYGSITMLVDDFSHIGQLHFGSVALGERRSRQLTLENASELGNARVKYEGYAMVRNGESEPSQPKTRFKCDLHVCVVDALKSVTLRVTFEPLSVDVGKEITAMLKFTVNDRFKLQCRATGKVTPRVPRLNRFGRLRKAKTSVDTVVVAPGAKHTQPPRIPATNSRQRTPLNARNTHFTISSALAQSEREPEQEPVLRPRPKVGDKRQSSVTIDFSPPRNGSKRRKTEPPRTLTPRKSIGASQDPDTKKPYSGSWWKQRQEFYDENWMAKQTEGFTKWINYVLLDGTSQRLGGGDTEGEEQDVGVKRRFDFSSLRVLAQKRMESKWAQAAVELYHSPNMDDILFNLQDEIGNKGLLFRADRPVYADVGLQEDLISLLNNYHPVWLCLGLYAVLGSQVMRQEKCSLRAIFRSTTAKATSGKKENSPPDRKMPRVLRRVILNHLVKDAHVARNYRLVKNLMTPLDGSTADRNDGGNSFTNTKKNINGREYFDSLTQSFMLKFLMLVIFLDRAIERKADKFPHFPCLFRIVPSVKKAAPGKGQTVTKSSKRNTSGNDDALWVKNSQVFVTEFCRLFLASEGRIDKHLKHLGYTLKHQQTPLDEIDLEVRSLEVDLRDGIRLAKLMEALTTTAVPSATEQDGEVIPQPKALSTFLRVPALSRLQKVHNVEICLHFLQDKCGASVLDNLKSNSCRGEKKHRLSGRVRVSSSGFAGLHSKVDAKLVENLAKDIVNGHREKTLALLWKLISSFQLQSLVDAETMRREVVNVVKRMSFRAKDFFDHQQHNAPLVHTDEHECYGLLLEWCRAVCANYNVEVSDFSASFADGKALCYLLHYYHPMLLSKSDMLSTTSDLHTPDVQGISEKALLANEQRHFAIINDRVKQLGEVPVLMPQQYNTKNPPEEKMVVTFVCYLQSRLMDSYSEIHAASRLKRWWKSPLIRLKLHRKKNRSARTIQRFWYTSSHKRLAIRQCRKLLRAAHLVKSSVQTWTARKHYIRFRRSVVVIQRAFRARRQLKINGDSRGAVLVIEYHWRKKLRWKREEERRLQSVMQRKVAQRVRSRSACAVIERHWLQRLSREAARLVRQQMIADRQLAVIRIQTAWRQSRQRVVARKQRMHSWQQMKRAARVIKRTWRAFQHRREETQRVVALQRFEQMMKEKELQKRHLKLKQKVETRAVKCVQRCFRQFTLRKRKVSATKLASVFRGRKQKIQFQKQKRAVVLLQRNARVWRRRRQLSALSQYYSMLKTYQRMRASEAQRRMIRIQELKHKVEKRAACRILAVYQSYRDQKRALAATKIQSLARCLRVRRRYCTLRQSALLLQKNVRIWRRQGQLRALLTFRSMLLSYRRMQREEEEHRERVRQDRIQRLQQSVGHRAAYRIQSVYRFFVHHKQMVAATLIQATYRGFKEQQQYTKTSACVRVMQRAIRSWLAMTKFRQALRLHRAAVTIQKCVRGRLSRRIRFNFYDLQTQLRRLRVLTSCWKIEFWYVDRTKKYRKKRTLMVRARWTQLSAGITRKRIADVKKIEMCWRSFCLKSAIDTRIQHKRQLNSSAQRVQVWWLGLCCKWAERERRAEEKRQREMEVMALAMAKTRAERIVGSWLRQRVIIPYRERNVHYVAVRRLQAWSRGMLVRLHQSAPEVTQQRKKLSKMKLVGQESHANSVTTSTTLQHLRVKTSEARSVQTEQPVTLGGRLDMALHMLLHGKRLQDMLFASHTIEVCTRYSRECCRKCVQLQISSTIFAAIRGLNRSRPHVELLHQLLLVLKNLTVYRRSADKRKPNREVATDTDDRLDVDMRALDTLVDLLHIHRDMHHVFVLSADVIKYYLTMLKPLADGNEGVRESWSEAEKRLTGLQELLSRKLALFNATASFRRVNQIPEKPSGNSLMRKMNPKTAVAIMEELVTLLER
ncbi:Abnormal spindle-like microcephaly-associated [Phytophthora citrophthora]|uniref:Abnormal spindle-like microcephaly-associated n=1 Tax=Phytophthora citrophthora TaxID=4793 RepID=A0AAD9GSK0_9STRA|nr:Abnormal spindle-like microcephaly-associated [Phytophthora citrophthora]